MKIMVTGATGFVGKHLVRALDEKHEVLPVIRERSVSSGADLVIPHIDSSTDWSGKLNDVDVVVHLAARVHVMQETEADPLSAFRTVNVEGTRTLAEQAAEQGVKRFIFMSTIKVHGEETNGRPYSADDHPSPADPYGKSKWEAEQILREISETTGMELVILRPPVVYGPGVKGNILRIAKLISTRIPLPFGSVKNRRSMVSIDNLLKWIERAINEEVVPAGPLLISDPDPVSTTLLVSKISEGMEVKARLLPVPPTALQFLLRLLGKGALGSRLLGDLELQPTFNVFPGLKDSLAPSAEEIKKMGESLRTLQH